MLQRASSHNVEIQSSGSALARQAPWWDTSRASLASLRSGASSNMNELHHRIAIALAAAFTLGCLSCKGPGAYVWVDSYTDSVTNRDGAYRISPGDVIQVRVFNQEQLTTRARVRADGKVSLPLVNDVPAAGVTPVALAADLQARLTEFVKAPNVTVSVEESRPAVVYVTGEVAKPAPYPIESSSGVLQAIVNAGGLTVNASPDRIFVLRQAHPAPQRIRFTYDDLIRLRGRAPTFQLQPGDVVVVE